MFPAKRAFRHQIPEMSLLKLQFSLTSLPNRSDSLLGVNICNFKLENHPLLSVVEPPRDLNFRRCTAIRANRIIA